ncbi:hypothetical protein LX77_00964 [Gelidibacter algens]|uniref:Uncharacterized protein n=1 Tax=Gelidibacter algens TaxID=49280 RepID=A0A1A7R2I5_9FLAO|nr:hypothetical protein A9996_04025 [Gelidibacter algens]RAJ26709.1 hypothetical protein LX77_00964 [Gelidibacter algens]
MVMLRGFLFFYPAVFKLFPELNPAPFEGGVASASTEKHKPAGFKMSYGLLNFLVSKFREGLGS